MGLLSFLPNNFKLIAKNLTQCAMQLSNDHAQRFNCDTDIFITAAVIQAYEYWSTREDMQLDVFIKKLRDLGSDASLVDIVVSVEIQMFILDSPHIDSYAVHDAVYGVRNVIDRTVHKTLKKRKIDPFRAMIVDAFMKKDECKPALSMIGIQNL